NLLALQFVRQTARIDISMTSWVAGFWPIGLGLLLSVPFLVYKIYPPEIKKSVEIPAWAGRELEKMGRLSRRELLMAGLAVVAVGLWVVGRDIVDATTVALVAISVMVITGLVNWDDIVGYKAAWNVWALLATLVTLADGLNRVGFIAWTA